MIATTPELLRDLEDILTDLHAKRQMYGEGQRKSELVARILRIEELYYSLKGH